MLIFKNFVLIFTPTASLFYIPIRVTLHLALFLSLNFSIRSLNHTNSVMVIEFPPNFLIS